MFENFLEKKIPSDGVKSKCFAHKCSKFLTFIFLRNYMIAIENKILIYHKVLTWGFFSFFLFFFLFALDTSEKLLFWKDHWSFLGPLQSYLLGPF